MKETLKKSSQESENANVKAAKGRLATLKKKKKNPSPTIEDFIDDSETEEEETDDDQEIEEEDHYKIYPKAPEDNDIIKIISHRGTKIKVDWRDKDENTDPMISLPLLWADYPHTVSMYRKKKKGYLANTNGGATLCCLLLIA